MRRKSAASAPSTARWSQVSVRLISGRGDELAVPDDRLLLHGADGEDRDLRRVEDGDELLDAEHPEVGDRERAALEVGLLQLSAARAVDELDAGRGDLLDRQPLGAADHRDDEPAVGRHRHADVGRRVDPHLLAGELGVQPPVAHERRRGDLREDVRDRRLRAVLRELDELLAERERPAHVRRHGDLEDRRLPGLGQAARDRLADRRQRHDLDLARRELRQAPPRALRPARISARSTSSATIRPSGPVPRSCARSMPRSRAIRRASGEALTRPFRSGSRTSVTCSERLARSGSLGALLALRVALRRARAFLLRRLVDLGLLGLGPRPGRPRLPRR